MVRILGDDQRDWRDGPVTRVASVVGHLALLSLMMRGVPSSVLDVCYVDDSRLCVVLQRMRCDTELNTPLVGIRGVLDLIQTRPWPPATSTTVNTSQDIVDLVIDQLVFGMTDPVIRVRHGLPRELPECLRTISLISTNWVNRSQHHLFCFIVPRCTDCV